MNVIPLAFPLSGHKYFADRLFEFNGHDQDSTGAKERYFDPKFIKPLRHSHRLTWFLRISFASFRIAVQLQRQSQIAMCEVPSNNITILIHAKQCAEHDTKSSQPWTQEKLSIAEAGENIRLWIVV